MGRRYRIGSVSPMAGQISMGARREIKAAVVERYRVAGRVEKGRISRRAVQGDWVASQTRGAIAGQSAGGRT